MNIELQEKLYKDFPKIFRQKDLSPIESCMHWGCECDDGWFWLIYNLCECIQSYIDNNDHLKIPQLEARQVKEKLATLRFYHQGGDEKIGGMIWLAEHMSETICEVCGQEGKIKSNRGWYKTLCPKCTKELKYDN